MSVYYYEPSYNWDRIFDQFFDRSPAALAAPSNSEPSGAVRSLRPRMDLHENAETNTVTATFELPGLKKEDVSIDAHNGQLTISGESKISSERDENGYAVRERRFGKFSRTLRLPQGVKDEDIKALLENGLLTVTFPKTGAAQVPKKITVA